MRMWFLFGALVMAANSVFAERPIVIAHRGASGYLPEHTLAAKAMAHAQGADYLEQDVVLTKDGVPIILHDIHLDRVTDVAQRYPDRSRDDGRYYAIDLTWTEIQELRVVERMNADGSSVFPRRFPTGVALFQVVSLEQELQFIQGLNRSAGRNAGIHLELKQPEFHHREGQDMSFIVLKTLKSYGYDSSDDLCFIQCFDEAELRRLREKFQTQLPLVFLFGNEKEWQILLDDSDALERRLESIRQFADGIGPTLSLVLREAQDANDAIATPLVAAAHRAGLVVHGWTFRADQVSCGAVDLDQLHRWAFDAGLDGFFSDFPDKTMQFLRANAP